jgi:hypothetical protein
MFENNRFYRSIICDSCVLRYKKRKKGFKRTELSASANKRGEVFDAPRAHVLKSFYILRSNF